MKEKRALAHIEKIEWVKPIEGADNIELIGVLGWRCIAKKGEFNVGDVCVYIEIDSKVPETSEFEFLRPRHFKIKTMKLNKFKDEYGDPVVSQGIAIPDKLFDSLYNKEKLMHKYRIGDDVTDVLGVTYYNPDDRRRKSDGRETKYDSMKTRHKNLFAKPFVKKMMKYKWFREFMFFFFGKKKDSPKKFPSWIQKTDEERIENLPQYLNDHNTVWKMTEKIDGTSTTYAIEKKFGVWDFIVCSRNLRINSLKQKVWHSENVYWDIANKYDMENVLKQIAKKALTVEKLKTVKRIVLQGETYGYKLQGNPYKMNDIDFAAFNLTIEGVTKLGLPFKRKYITDDICDYLEGTNVKCVPILGTYTFPEGISMHDFKLEANGKSMLADVKREGIVYRNVEDARQSFKNVSNDYLLSKKE